MLKIMQKKKRKMKILYNIKKKNIKYLILKKICVSFVGKIKCFINIRFL